MIATGRLFQKYRGNMEIWERNEREKQREYAFLVH